MLDVYIYNYNGDRMGLASNLPSLWGIWSTNMASSFKPTQMTWLRQQKPWQVTGKIEVWVQSLGYGFVKQFVQWRSQATPVWIIWSSQAQWLLDTADSIRSFGGSGCENRRFVPQLCWVTTKLGRVSHHFRATHRRTKAPRRFLPLPQRKKRS